MIKSFSDNDFKYLSQEVIGDLLKLVKQKGVYPYGYKDGFEMFSEDKLPDRCEIVSFVKNKCISDNNYFHAIKVWYAFKMNAVGDYHDLHLKIDVWLLVNFFEKFITMCLEYHLLDLCHYFSTPGLSWDAMLKMTEIESELISDIDTDLFIEKGRYIWLKDLVKQIINT